MRRLSGQDRFAATLTEVSPALLAYLRRRVDSEDAADLLAETMVVAWRRFEALPEDAEQARRWLFGIARNVLLNAQRGERRRWSLADRAREAIAQSAPASDHGIEVRDAITRLPEELGELVRLVHWEGFAIGEAAEIMGILPSTARSRYQRAKEELRSALGVSA